MKYIKKRAREIGPEMAGIYTDLHENPELGGEEIETAKKVISYLDSLGIEVLGEHIGKTENRGGEGVVARIKGKEGGQVIALRADMDALPMQESEENVPKSKKKNVMHGCGHDTHTTALLGSAKILKELADKGEFGAGTRRGAREPGEAGGRRPRGPGPRQERACRAPRVETCRIRVAHPHEAAVTPRYGPRGPRDVRRRGLGQE